MCLRTYSGRLSHFGFLRNIQQDFLCRTRFRMLETSKDLLGTAAASSPERHLCWKRFHCTQSCHHERHWKEIIQNILTSRRHHEKNRVVQAFTPGSMGWSTWIWLSSANSGLLRSAQAPTAPQLEARRKHGSKSCEAISTRANIVGCEANLTKWLYKPVTSHLMVRKKQRRTVVQAESSFLWNTCFFIEHSSNATASFASQWQGFRQKASFATRQQTSP